MLNYLDPTKRTEALLASKRAERRDRQATVLIDEKNHTNKKRMWFNFFNRKKSSDENHLSQNLLTGEGETGVEVFGLENDVSGFDNFITVQRNPKVLECLQKFQGFIDKCNNLYSTINAFDHQCNYIKQSTDYEQLKQLDTFKNFQKDNCILKENIAKFKKKFECILELKNKMLSEKEPSNQIIIANSINELLSEHNKALNKAREVFYPMMINFQLQKNFYDILNTLTLKSTTNSNKEAKGLSKVIKNFFNFEEAKDTSEFDVIASHKTLNFRNVTIDNKYCNLNIETLNTLDQISGKIIDYSSDFKEERVDEAREIVKKLIYENTKNKISPELNISAYKAQKVMYTLNQLLIGTFDAYLPEAFELKQKSKDAHEKKLIEQTLHKLDSLESNNNPLKLIYRKLTSYSQEDKYKELYTKEKKLYAQKQKFYNGITFDQNSNLILDIAEKYKAPDNANLSISLTNVFGVNNNQFTQVGNMVSTGEKCIIMKNTIGPNFQAVLIGSTIETACMNNIASLNFKDVYKSS